MLARQATDELEESAGGEVPRWGARIRALEAYLALHPEIVVVDPLDRVRQVSALQHFIHVAHSAHAGSDNFHAAPACRSWTARGSHVCSAGCGTSTFLAAVGSGHRPASR